MPAQTTYTMDPDRGINGQLGKHAECKSMYNNETSTSMPFGRACKRDTTVAGGRAAKMLAANTDTLVGISGFDSVYENGPNGELDTTGVKPGGQVNMLREGMILVLCEGGCTTGDRLWVRATGGTVGALRATDAGSSTCIDATKIGEWQETVSDGQLAWLFVDFSNKQ